MKKILLVLVCSLFAFETVSAQGKNAVGLRLGDGVEFLYQCDLSSRNFLQFTLATPHFEGLSVTGIYNWRCCRWNWTPQTCDWYLNVGVGGALGLYDFDDSGFLLGVAGSCAFGCHFKNAPISFPELAGILFQLAVRVQKATGVHIGYINLSGGVGIPYRPEQTENDIMAIGEGVRKKFEEILVPAGMGDVAIFTEMGRFTTGPYGALVATAIHEKHIYKEYIGLDACAANLMRPAMYGAYHHITVLGKENEPCDHMYDVVGGLCENNDKFAIDRMLPKIDIGDIVYIHDTGAHGSAMGYNYNGKLRSAEVLLCEDGTHRLIRRAETPRDYFATLDFLPLMKPLFED